MEYEWNEYLNFRIEVCNCCQNKCRQITDIDKCISEGINMVPIPDKTFTAHNPSNRIVKEYEISKIFRNGELKWQKKIY